MAPSIAYAVAPKRNLLKRRDMPNPLSKRFALLTRSSTLRSLKRRTGLALLLNHQGCRLVFAQLDLG